MLAARNTTLVIATTPLLIFALCSPLAAQCTLGWDSNGLGSTHPLVSLVETVEIVDLDGPGPNGEVALIGGQFTAIGGSPATTVAGVDLATGAVRSFGNNLLGPVGALTSDRMGAVFAASFPTLLATGPTLVSRSTGSGFTTLGTVSGGGGFFGPAVDDLAVLPNGDLVAGGSFTSVAGVTANNVARFDGGTWSAMGSGIQEPIRTLFVRSDGTLLAGTFFSGPNNPTAFLRFDGTDWVPFGLGVTGISGAAQDIDELPNGDLVAAGGFVFPPSSVAHTAARWNGIDWVPLGQGIQDPAIATSIAALPDGSVVAGGFFGSAGGVAAINTALFDGTSWRPIGAGLGRAGSTDQVLSLSSSRSTGQVFAGGIFPAPGGGAGNVARLTNPCAAGTTTFSSSGIGPGGPAILSTQQGAFLGGELRLAVNRSGGQAIVVTGFAQTSVPLSTLLGAQGIGTLAVNPIAVVIQGIGANGTALSLPIPQLTNLIGVPIFAQTVITPSSGPLLFVASNGLRITVGSF